MLRFVRPKYLKIRSINNNNDTTIQTALSSYCCLTASLRWRCVRLITTASPPCGLTRQLVIVIVNTSNIHTACIQYNINDWLTSFDDNSHHIIPTIITCTVSVFGPTGRLISTCCHVVCMLWCSLVDMTTTLATKVPTKHCHSSTN